MLNAFVLSLRECFHDQTKCDEQELLRIMLVECRVIVIYFKARDLSADIEENSSMEICVDCLSDIGF